ncbi:hypothetical protein FBY03_12523 [Pseudomonas sp. SJZ079]|uniref:hypothetical protein n=1 Tax=Pseudomonas sp. SJZ079 TaxID=2572887 RepID=UPI00119A9FBA|nr:hypothetical protein [Pseudomonas sp. SJZ079]TWC30199.1 hypothetical protein FBY03_12523 [Pseudomonas sp. SJZ079]
MAITVDGEERDTLSFLLDEPFHDRRRDIWLWLKLYLEKKADFDTATCNGSTMRDEIARFLNRNPRLLKDINPTGDRALLPGECLKWIEEDERQYQWLLHSIEDITDLNPPSGLPRLVHLSRRDHLIAMLDLWDIEIEKKEEAVENLRDAWLNHKARDSDYEWFADKKEGAKRCKCAREWLEKNRRTLSTRLPPFSNYKELLLHFDEANLGPYEQKAMIQEIKRQWNRQQFDERNSDKKQVNVMLSKSVIAQLDELVKQHKIKRAQIVEKLVRMEADTGMYLAED